MTRFGTRLSSVLYWLLIAWLAGIVLSVILLIGIFASLFLLVPADVLDQLPRYVLTHGPCQMAGWAAMLASRPASALFVVFLLVKSACAGTVGLALMGMMRSVSGGTPFDIANVKRLYLIAWASGIGLIAGVLIPVIGPASLWSFLRQEHMTFSLGGLGSLLFALVLAEVLREGIRLRDDADMTV